MAGIYHNATLGVISLSSDGSNWITIADKNLGATQVWNSGDTLSEANCGKYYQWGNNYGFPNTGSVTTSSTAVNAGTYGPGNYYSSSTFITAQPRDSSNNANLRGDTTDTNVARQGPCDTGFHIPSVTDAQSLIDTLYNIVGGKKQTEFGIYLFMTKTQIRTAAGAISTPSYANFVLSKAYSNSSPNVLRFGTSTDATVTSATSKSQAFPIRPFKNEAVVPDYTWIKLYGDDIPEPKKLKRLQNGGNYYYFKDAPTHASAISLNKSSITLTEAGQTEQLTATVTPSDAVDKSIIWTSSNENVARVSSNGLVSCITPGDCTITATTNDGNHTASCSVSMIHVTGVSLNTNSINLSTVGQTYQLTATITPNDATNKNVTWSSSDTSIATVSSTGLITCVTPGSATITVTTEDGGYTATCSVTNIKYLSVCYLIVGGGGNGYTACWAAGGGGGGAVCCGGTTLNSNHTYDGTSKGYWICVGGPGGTSSIYGYTYAAGGCNGGCRNGGASGSGLAGGGTNRDYAGGGGGGAGSTGMPGNEYYGGEGGAGLYGYGGGGGGGGSGSCAAGRDGGGGNGVGPTNCGGGGGGGYGISGSGGACGVVDICYLIGAGGGTGGNCCYTCNGYCVHRFTSTGVFKVND